MRFVDVIIAPLLFDVGYDPADRSDWCYNAYVVYKGEKLETDVCEVLWEFCKRIIEKKISADYLIYLQIKKNE